MDIPARCEELTTVEQCVRKNTLINYECGWTGSICLDK